VAFDLLRRIEEQGAYSSAVLAGTSEDLKTNDRALTQELVMGVLRRRLWLDHLIEHYSGREVGRLDVPVCIALRLGLYQLRYMSRIPESAAVNESVSLIRSAGFSSAAAFVNAVLRRATREPDYVADISDSAQRLSLETSHPLWLIQRWIETWGWEEASAFAQANNEVAPTAFRIVNNANSDQVLETLRSAGAEIVPSKVSPSGWRSNGRNPTLYDLARKGQVYIQDEASQLVAHVLDAAASDRVLDVCAAPGGKATHISDLAGPSSIVVAGDLHRHRLQTIKTTARAQQIRNIHCVVLDGTSELPFEKETFDGVLVDAPCTGTGTLRRNPEIRYRVSAADFEDLPRRQFAILMNAAPLVRSGGRLVYSTCSVEPEENEAVIEKFVGQHPDFQPASLEINPTFLTGTNTARLWPHREGADGFFIAAFERG
jgi:16S rRNA (cytosine967-C5)-methyltransferase